VELNFISYFFVGDCSLWGVAYIYFDGKDIRAYSPKRGTAMYGSDCILSAYPEEWDYREIKYITSYGVSKKEVEDFISNSSEDLDETKEFLVKHGIVCSDTIRADLASRIGIGRKYVPLTIDELVDKLYSILESKNVELSRETELSQVYNKTDKSRLVDSTIGNILYEDDYNGFKKLSNDLGWLLDSDYGNTSVCLYTDTNLNV